MNRPCAVALSAAALLAAALPAAAAGRITFQALPPKNQRFQVLAPVFKHQRLPAIATAIGRNMVLPRDLPVVAAECGSVNAFYDPQAHRVVLCYELAAFFGIIYEKKANVDRTKSLDYALNGMTFTLLHELGHAIIGELDLGVTGGEEDAVDDFATLLLLDAKLAGLAVDGAEAMLDLGALSRGKVVFSDEHSFSPQRFYNVLCMIYGSDPPTMKPMVDRGYLPAARAVRCPDEYRRKRKAWDAMVGPHRRR
jgi:hypothetical protein